MSETTTGIPNLPDLTHANELIQFGDRTLNALLTIALLIAALGIAIALINSSLHRYPNDRHTFIEEWIPRYSILLKGFQHTLLVAIVLVVGFFFFSTLANRYHYWEQSRIAKIAATVEGDRIEQAAPTLRYETEEPNIYYTQVGEKLVRVEDKQKVSHQLALTSSDINVNLAQILNLQDNRQQYFIDFAALYKITNTLTQTKTIFFELSPPYSYSLLQNLKVEREKERLQPKNPDNYSFPLVLAPGESTNLKVTYQAQGAPRWVYNAGGQLISNFRLAIIANFANADFASGIAPTETKDSGSSKIFTWIFQENVSVQNPFGVFTATSPVRNTGVIPRLLLLAPAIWLWWLLLLYLSLPIDIRQIAIAAGIFFACLLTLTYLSRSLDAKLAWSMISLLLLGLVWGLGATRRQSRAAIACTVSGLIIPVLGLLIPYSGLTLSLAGLLSVTWLVMPTWRERR
jgi:hypothetical protein